MLAWLVTSWSDAGLTPVAVALLAAAAFAAGFVDAIAGGGGVLTVPALLAAGLPPQLALGTNKGQAVFGSGAALLAFVRAGKVDRDRAPSSFVAGLVGSAGGAALVLLLSPEVLRPLVIVLLIVVAAFLTFRPGLTARRVAVPEDVATRIRLALAVALGAYDGFFGPGTGTFLIFGYVMLLGLPLTTASAEAKVVNFASNLAALLVFAGRGVVLWPVALSMAVAQFAGGWTGAHVAVRGGDRLVRGVVLVVVAALVVKLGVDAWGAA